MNRQKCKYGNERCRQFQNTGQCRFSHSPDQSNSTNSTKCKYGNERCRQYQNTGQCRFSHSPDQPNSTKQNFGNNNYHNPNQYLGPRNQQYKTDYRQNRGGIHHQNNMNTNHNNYNNMNNNMNNNINPKPYKNNSNHQLDQYTKKFCRNFQLNNDCQFQNCKWFHKYTQKDNFKKLNVIKDVLKHKDSNLFSFLSQEKRIYSLRMGHQIVFFQFNPNTSEFINVNFKFALPNLDINYNFYWQKDFYVYFAYENKVNGLNAFGYYNLATQKMMSVEGAHQNFITGITHFNDQIVITSSLDGSLKVWKVVNNQLLLDAPSTQVLFKHYSNGNKNFKIELLFLYHTQINGTKIIAVGTNDSRLLFWIGNQMNFRQAVFDTKFSNIISVRYFNYDGNPAAMVAAWNNNSTVSALIGLDLNTFVSNVFIEINAPQNDTRQNISVFQCISDLLLVGNGYGLVSLYKIPDFKNKIGVIMHNNSLSQILAVENLTSNNIVTKNVFILERMDNNKEGSLSVYLYKN